MPPLCQCIKYDMSTPTKTHKGESIPFCFPHLIIHLYTLVTSQVKPSSILNKQEIESASYPPSCFTPSSHDKCTLPKVQYYKIHPAPKTEFPISWMNNWLMD
ncbi:hypothetical protein ACJW31_09G026600 [Castanea mollissima]